MGRTEGVLFLDIRPKRCHDSAFLQFVVQIHGRAPRGDVHGHVGDTGLRNGVIVVVVFTEHGDLNVLDVIGKVSVKGRISACAASTDITGVTQGEDIVGILIGDLRAIYYSMNNQTGATRGPGGSLAVGGHAVRVAIEGALDGMGCTLDLGASETLVHGVMDKRGYGVANVVDIGVSTIGERGAGQTVGPVSGGRADLGRAGTIQENSVGGVLQIDFLDGESVAFQIGVVEINGNLFEGYTGAQAIYGNAYGSDGSLVGNRILADSDGSSYIRDNVIGARTVGVSDHRQATGDVVTLRIAESGNGTQESSLGGGVQTGTIDYGPNLLIAGEGGHRESAGVVLQGRILDVLVGFLLGAVGIEDEDLDGGDAGFGLHLAALDGGAEGLGLGGSVDVLRGNRKQDHAGLVCRFRGDSDTIVDVFVTSTEAENHRGQQRNRKYFFHKFEFK